MLCLPTPTPLNYRSTQITAGGVFVAELDGDIVGFAAVLPRADGQTELDGLFVEPNMWRCGIGRSLVEHCERFACSLGATALHVIGNPHAKDFYVACGFEVVGEHQTRFGVGLAMQKKL